MDDNGAVTTARFTQPNGVFDAQRQDDEVPATD